LIETLLADDFLLTRVLTEEDVENDANEGHEEEHQEPSYRLCRLPVVEQDGYHHGYIGEDIERDECPMEVYHRPGTIWMVQF